MCGIFGYYSTTNKINVENLDKRLNRMANAQRHRGPDYYDKKIGLNFAIGMNRLSVFDKESYSVPFNRSHTITAFNGEAYSINGVDMSYLAKSEGDGGVIADMLDQNFDKPSGALKLINGMYAIASVSKSGEKLILARDRAGEKPIYYYDSGLYIVFASEIKTILAFFLNESEYPIYRHTDDFYFLEGYVNHETPFSNIFSVKPGHIIEFYKGTDSKQIEYWEIPQTEIETNNLINERNVIEEFNHLLTDSVRLRKLNSSTMITSLLSGGVDSTIVTTIARPNLAFTGEYETPGFTEGIVPSVLCKKIGIEHKIIKPTRVDFESYIDEIVWYSDTPVTWTAFNLYMMFKEVAQTGSRVCLTGEGSDEIFNGYARHSIYLNAWNIINSPLWPQYKELIFNFQSDPIASYLKLTSRSSVESLYSKNLYTELFYKNKNLSNFISAVDFKTSMQILLQMADRMSMRFGVEARSPFLDYRIIEFGMKLNTRFKMKDTIGKYIVRKTGELLNNGVDYLSVEKKGFGVPFNYWYGESGFSRHAYFNLSLKKHAELYESFKKFNTALNIFSIIGQK
jgi:asparagine synthase (glutamine-hydrolysing)